jgi:holo-[acyl-carrier protein] synthase
MAPGVLSVGLDIVELAEFAESVAHRRVMVRRVFTARELAYADGPRRIERLAARFAAKEATFKAVGTGWAEGVGWRDAEVVSSAGAPPELVVRGALKRRARALGGTAFRLSLSHSGSYAAAIVLLVAE